MADPARGIPEAGDELRALRAELDRARSDLRETADKLRVAQEQIVQAGKLSALGQLVAGVAHEMNNPLTSVIGYAQLLHQQFVNRPELTAQARDLLPDIGHILAESSRVARIVRNLLMFARRQTVARAHHDVEFLCDQVVELRSYDLRLNGIEIATSFAPDLPPVFADASQVQQVLLNLILNAEQAVLHTRVRRIDVRVTAEPACAAVLVEVRDTGPGIAADSLGRVFDPFFTTRPAGEGTGLGLSIAQSIVRDHGGRIWVESEPQVGTAFFVRLPAGDRLSQPGSKGVALVMHEDAGVRNAIGAVFTGWGFDVQIAAGLAEGLADGGADPAVVVADAEVVRHDPERWRHLWSRWGTSRLIAISDGADADPADAALRARARAIVGSQADLCELRRAVVAALGA